MRDKWPNITRAFLAIAYDNGMINRFNSEETFLAKGEEVIGADGVYEDDLAAFESFLGSLTDQEFEDVCVGESDDMKKVVDRSPKNAEGHPLTGLLEDIFNHG